MQTDLSFATANELQSLYRQHALSPVEATQALLDRIARINPIINAFCLVDGDAALKSAAASEARWAKDAALGPLDGVPVSIKDLLLTRGWPTLRGSLAIGRDQTWPDDAPAVARLREQGAVLLGKTATPEFGWKGVTDSLLTGITRNPWNLALTPGGSSGGAAAQLAAGLGPLALGTDGGGSIRIPASFSGVVGMKPTFGRVPAWPLSPFGTLATVGPLARTVSDAALLLNAISQPDARDWHALPPVGDFTAGLGAGIKGVKIAFSPNLGYAPVKEEVARVIADAPRLFRELGALVDEIDPGFADPTPVFWTHWTVGAHNLLRAFSQAQRNVMETDLVKIALEGSRVALTSYLDAEAARGKLGADLRLFHERYDLLLTPTVSVPPFPVGQMRPSPEPGQDWTFWTPFTYPFNLTRQPAISVPAGFTDDGLPVGLQIVGQLFGDHLVLRAARAFERAFAIERWPDLARSPAPLRSIGA